MIILYVALITISRGNNWGDCSFPEGSMNFCICTWNNILFEMSRGHKPDLSLFVRICPECVRIEGLFRIAAKLSKNSAKSSIVERFRIKFLKIARLVQKLHLCPCDGQKFNFDIFQKWLDSNAHAVQDVNIGAKSLIDQILRIKSWFQNANEL